MEVERTIEFIIDMQAKAEVRMAKSDERMAKYDERMAKFDKRLEATRRLVEAGMKIVSHLAADTRELKRSQKAFLDSLRNSGNGRRHA